MHSGTVSLWDNNNDDYLVLTKLNINHRLFTKYHYLFCFLLPNLPDLAGLDAECYSFCL